MKNVKESLKSLVVIKGMSFLAYSALCCTKKSKSYRAKLDDSERQLERELDLKRFITRQRMHNTALLGLMSSHQNFFVSKLSRTMIKDENLHSEQRSDSFSSGESSGAAEKNEHKSDSTRVHSRTKFLEKVA